MNRSIKRIRYFTFFDPTFITSFSQEHLDSDEYEGITGKYFDNDKGDVKGHFGEAHPDAYSEQKIAQLIQTTDAIIRG